MNFQFANIWFLYLVWLAPAVAALWYATYRRRQRALEAAVSPHMRAKLAPPSPRWRFMWQLGLACIGLLLMLIAAARPQWGMGDEIVYERGRDLVIALDVSRSMLATDVRPSRLNRAKLDIMDLIRELHGDRIALVVFRGKAAELCPLTTDYAYLRQELDSAAPESAPRGETDIADGILKSLDAFESDQGAHKAIILVSDGEDLAGRAAAAAEKARKAGVPIFTVGLGNPQGAPVPSPAAAGGHMMYQGREVVSKLEHETLRIIAETTGGAYLPVALADVRLGQIYRDHLSRIAAQDFQETLQRRHIERYQWFLLPAVLLLLAAAFLSRGRLVASRRRVEPQSGWEPLGDKPPVNAPASVKTQGQSHFPGAAALAALLCGTALSLQAAGANPAVPAPSATNAPPPAAAKTASAGGRAGARAAQRLYVAGQYEAAAMAYTAAAKEASAQLHDSLIYNAGCAYFRAAKYKEAADCFRELSQGEAAGAVNPSYNLGCTLYASAESPGESSTNAGWAEKRAELLKDAAQAFQKVIRAQPPNGAARDNFSIAAESIPKAEEDARVARLMAQYSDRSPFDILDQLYQNQAAIVDAIPKAFADTSPSQITELEDLARRQSGNAELLLPLGAKLSQAAGAGQNAQQTAALTQNIEALRDEMKTASARLRDLDETGYSPSAKSGATAYGLWKALAPYSPLMREDIRRQTNALALTEPLAAAHADPNARSKAGMEQAEALDLTRLFKERFSQQVPPEGLQSPPEETAAGSGTNRPTASTNQLISAQNREKILSLTSQALAAQQRGLDTLAQTNITLSIQSQQESRRILSEIENLLPRQKQQKDQDQQKQQPSEGEKQSQPKPSPSPQPPKAQPPQEPQEQETEETQPQKKEMSEEDARRLMEKALQREKEHTEEKRERESYIPPSPINRDW